MCGSTFFSFLFLLLIFFGVGDCICVYLAWIYIVCGSTKEKFRGLC